MPVTNNLASLNYHSTYSCPDVNNPKTILASRSQGYLANYQVSINADLILAGLKGGQVAPSSGHGPQVTSPAVRSELNSLLSMLGSGADLSFLVFALQIQQMDQQVAAEIKTVQHAGKMRETYSKRLDELREMRNQLATEDKDLNDGDTIEIKHQGHRAEVLREVDYLIDPKTGEIATQKGDLLGEQAFKYNLNGKYDIDANEVSLGDIDAEIKRVEAMAHQLDSNREVQMIMLNQTLNRKNQAVSQLTNLLKKSHDTKSAVINNLR